MNQMTVALAQIAPVWLDKKRTTDKILTWIEKAADVGAQLVCFGEALLPGYPFWLSLTDGARFDSSVQKELHAHYLANAVQIESGDLDSICALAKAKKLAVYLGIIERPLDRGGHSVYASLVYINAEGQIQSVHRKLQPTYEERLTWSPGDGNGLQVHDFQGFRVGGLNCWENWMPMARTALYAQGENVHVAVWPGTDINTSEITRFIARESRSYSLAVSGLLRKSDIESSVPHAELIRAAAPEVLANGGSCIAGPDAHWLAEPLLHKEGLVVGELHLNKVFEERQNFDPSGHYSRPDVLNLKVNRERQRTVDYQD